MNMGEAEDRIRNTIVDNSPAEARAYYLHTTLSRFPANGGWPLHPFQPPSGVVTGSYRLAYLNDHGEVVQPRFTAAPPRIDISADMAAAPQATAAVKVRAGSPPVGKAVEPLANDRRHVADLVEFSRERMTDEILENRQLLSKKLSLAHDQAEQLVLQRAYRHELSAQLVAGANHSQRTADILERLQGLFMTMIAQQQAIEQRRCESLAKEPSEQPPSTASNLFNLVSPWIPAIAALFGTAKKSRKKNGTIKLGEDEDYLASIKAEIKAMKKEVKEKTKQKEERKNKSTKAKQKKGAILKKDGAQNQERGTGRKPPKKKTATASNPKAAPKQIARKKS